MILKRIFVNLIILALISSTKSWDDYNCKCPIGIKNTYRYCGRELMKLNKVAKEKVKQTTCESERIYWCIKPKGPGFVRQLCDNGTVCSYRIIPSKSLKHPTAMFRDCLLPNATELEDIPEMQE